MMSRESRRQMISSIWRWSTSEWAWNNGRQKTAWIKDYTLRLFLWVCFDDESFSRFIAMKQSLACKQNSNSEILSRARSRIKSNSSTEDRELWPTYLSRNERELLGVSWILWNLWSQKRSRPGYWVIKGWAEHSRADILRMQWLTKISMSDLLIWIVHPQGRTMRSL